MKIAIDFDGTCVEHKFPYIGEELHGAVETLKWLVEEGHELILWTCREDVPGDPERAYLTNAVNWFKEHQIPLIGINSTPDQYEFRPADSHRRKVVADLYIDDKNLGGFSGWAVVFDELEGEGPDAKFETGYK
ncbi:MAG: hypothetical protein JKX97_08275 [Candidatus Lindowbacteria bacterium]|nr:hypothetical protein [Candidatus Lindowbacteria bacterium]